jgi:excisionase family DNA binding protein
MSANRSNGAATEANSATEPRQIVVATPALALTVREAAAALSVSYDTFHEQIEPELRIVRLGRRKLIPVAELQRWLEAHAEALLPLEDG